MGIDEGAVRRAWRRTTLLAVIGFVVGAVGGGLIAGSDPLRFVLTVLGFGMTVGGLAGMVSLLATTVRLAGQVQVPLTGLFRDDRRMVRRAVASGKPLQSADPELLQRAFDHAWVMAIHQPLMLGQLVLLYVGIAGTEVPQLMAHDPFVAVLNRCVVGFLLVVGTTAVICFGRSIRAARRYVRTAHTPAYSAT